MTVNQDVLNAIEWSFKDRNSAVKSIKKITHLNEGSDLYKFCISYYRKEDKTEQERTFVTNFSLDELRDICIDYQKSDEYNKTFSDSALKMTQIVIDAVGWDFKRQNSKVTRVNDVRYNTKSFIGYEFFIDYYDVYGSRRTYTKKYDWSELTMVEELYKASDNYPKTNKTNNKYYSTDKVINSTLNYNSIDSVRKSNLIVIQFIKEGYSPLQSVTLNDYYVAELITEQGDEKYKLYTNNYMDRKSEDPIKIMKYITDGQNGRIIRFKEYKIEGWVEKDQFKKDSCLLFPLIDNGTITNKDYCFIVDIISGKLTTLTNFAGTLNNRTELSISKYTSDDDYLRLSDKYPGICALLKKPQITKEIAVEGKVNFPSKNNYAVGFPQGSVGFYIDPPAKIDVQRYYNTKFDFKHLNELTEKCIIQDAVDKFNRLYSENLTEDQIQRRILADNPKPKRHNINPEIGINQEYLLI